VKQLALIVLVVTIVSSPALNATPPEHLPAIGDKVKKQWLPADERMVCMTNPAQLDPCFERVFDGVQFLVAYRSKTRRVTYLFTSDERFQTADGIRVGDELRVTEANVQAVPGWEVYASTTRDGWRPIIGLNDEVKLKDGTNLKIRYLRDGSESGSATITGFSRGRF
jgi:hypothetical protein